MRSRLKQRDEHARVEGHIHTMQSRRCIERTMIKRERRRQYFLLRNFHRATEILSKPGQSHKPGPY